MEERGYSRCERVWEAEQTKHVSPKQTLLMLPPVFSQFVQYFCSTVHVYSSICAILCLFISPHLCWLAWNLFTMCQTARYIIIMWTLISLFWEKVFIYFFDPVETIRGRRAGRTRKSGSCVSTFDLCALACTHLARFRMLFVSNRWQLLVSFELLNSANFFSKLIFVRFLRKSSWWQWKDGNLLQLVQNLQHVMSTSAVLRIETWKTNTFCRF